MFGYETTLIVIGVLVILVGIWLLIKISKFLIKMVILFSILIFLAAGGYGFVSGHKDLQQYVGYVKQGHALVLKDTNIWNYLDSSSKKYDFNKTTVQYLRFDKPANVLLAPIKVGQVIHFPAFSKKVLPLGITFKIVSKKMENGILVMGVVQPANQRILTKKDLKSMESQNNSSKSGTTSKPSNSTS